MDIEYTGYIVPIAVINSNTLQLEIHDVDSDWDSERIEEFIESKGHKISECNWGIFDGNINDYRKP